MDARVLLSAGWLGRKMLNGLLLLGCLALAGCTTLNHMQCQVWPAEETGAEAVISDADRDAVRAILQTKAAELNLVDWTERSLVPQTIIYLIALDTDYPMKLLAWEQENRIVVDFMHAPNIVGETRQFRDAREQLFVELQEAFPGRMKMIAIRDQVTAGERYVP